MKRLAIAAVAGLLTLSAAPADAFTGIVRQCFTQHLEGPQVRTSRHRVRAAYEQFEHRDGRVVRVYYPAVYQERTTVVRPEIYVLRPTAC